MNHAVEKYFKQAYEQAAKTYVPPRSAHYIEQNIGLKAHVQRVMPLFLTLRDAEGKALVTAMLPPRGKDERSFKPIIVGFDNTDPYPEHGDAIRQLAGTTASPSIRPAATPIGASDDVRQRCRPVVSVSQNYIALIRYAVGTLSAARRAPLRLLYARSLKMKSARSATVAFGRMRI